MDADRVAHPLLSTQSTSPSILGAEARNNPAGLFELFPEIHQVTLRARAISWDLAQLAELNPPVPSELRRAVPKRQAEYWLGRWCVATALAAAGCDGARWLAVGAHGPTWPSEFIGSLTHTSDYVSAAVARRSLIAAVGIDSERILDAASVAALRSVVLSPEELELCEQTARRASTSVRLLATLSFSAKESLFKAAYPRVGFLFGFENARLRSIDLTSGTFELVIADGLGAALPAGSVIRGSHAIEPECVHTAVVFRTLP